MGNMRINDYIAEIGRIRRTGSATEHSYRGALQRLLADLMPGLTVLNEPRRIACGAPDYIIARRGVPVAFVEAKDIGDADLDGKRASGHKEQFDRYKASLSAIAFTDYLDFHLYLDGHPAESVRIGELRNGAIVATGGDAPERFRHLIGCLADAEPHRITTAPQLVRLMAGRARLLQEAAARFLRNCGPDDGLSVPRTSLGKLMSDFRRVLMPDVGIDEFSDIYAQTVTYGMFAARLHDKTPDDFSRFEAASLIPKSNPFLQQLFGQLALSLEDEIAWLVDSIAELFAFSDVARIMRDYGAAGAKADPMVHFYEDFLAAYDAGLRKDRGVWYTPVPVVRFIVRAVDYLLQSRFGLQDGLADASRCDASAKLKIENGELKIGDGGKDNSQLSLFNSQLPFRVQVLDPALGTATFLAECIRQIHSRFAGNEGMWQDYVEKSLIPRLNGFELLMASYTMAHVKLDLVLQATGCERAASRRFNVFLTDSLTPGHGEQLGKLFSLILGEEAEAANRVKRDCPVMVVLGNPPYNGESRNKGAWIMRLMEDYKVEPGGEEKLNERNPKWLNDDYVKFIRLAEDYVERNGSGIVAYITPHGFLDAPTFRGMRWRLTRTFDEIFVLNLHGNAKKKEKAPDGSKDENVFDIMQGVCISLFVKRGGDFNAEAQRSGELLSLRGEKEIGRLGGVIKNSPNLQNSKTPSGESNPHHFCLIRYADLYGKRADKFAFLESHDLASVEWQTLKPQAPMYFFVPKDFSLQEEYEKGFKITDLMPLNGMGITTAHDDFVYGGCDELFERFSRFKNSQAHENLYQKFNVSEKAGWDILKGHSALQGISDLRSLIKPIAYRPFDDKFVFYEDTLVWRSVRQIFKHFSLKPEGFVQTGLTGFTGLGVDGNPDNPVNPVKKDSASSAPPRLCVENNRTDNLALCLLRINRGDNAVSVFVTDKITDKTILSSKDNATVFPLYLYHEEMGRLVREPNLNPEIVAKINAECRMQNAECAIHNAQCTMHNDGVDGEQLSNRQTVPASRRNKSFTTFTPCCIRRRTASGTGSS